MEEIGSVLRQAREQLGLTLEEVERATRIRARNLAVLESGDWESLASTVQARGFLKNYAEFLGLDAEWLLTRYAEALQSRRTRPRARPAAGAPPARSVQIRSRRPRWLSSDLLVAAAVTLTVMVILIWGLGRLTAAVRGEEGTGTPPTATAPAAPTEAVALAPTSAVVVAPPPAAGPSPTTPPLILPGAGMSLRILVVHSAWMRVTIDGEVAFSGRVRPGNLLEYVGQELIEVNTGNGAGLRVYYNGEDQGTLGDLGQVVTRLWSPEGVITPTPTHTRTPTATPRVTPTPPPTAGG